MRSLRDTRKAIAMAPIHVKRQADDTVLKHLLRELPESTDDSVGWRTQTGHRIAGRIALLTSTVVVVVATIWLLQAQRASPSRESVPAATTDISGIALLTEISQERAYRRGGIQAVEDQCREALATSAKEPASPSFEELLAELAGDVDTMGGANL